MRVNQLPRGLWWVFLVSVGVWASACQKESGGDRASSAAKKSDGVVRFGVMPAVQSERIADVYRPLTHQMAGAIGRPVELTVATSYDQLRRDLVEGRIDLAQVSSHLYVSLAVSRKKGNQPFHVAVRKVWAYRWRIQNLVVKAQNDLTYTCKSTIALKNRSPHFLTFSYVVS